MGLELGVEPCGESAQTMGMVGLDVELEGQLAVHGLDQLAQMGMQASERLRRLGPVIGTRHGGEREVAACGRVGRAMAR